MEARNIRIQRRRHLWWRLRHHPRQNLYCTSCSTSVFSASSIGGTLPMQFQPMTIIFTPQQKKSKNAFKEATIVGTEMPSWILKGFLWKKALNHYYRIWNKKELEFCNCYCKNWQNRFGEKGLKCVVAPRRSFFPLQFWNAIPLIHWFSAFTDFHQGNFEKDKEIPKKISHIFYFKSIQIQIRIYQKYSHYIRS